LTLAAVGSLLCAGCGDDGESPTGGDVAEPAVISAFDQVHVSSVADAEYFQHAVASVDLGTDELARATLSVSLESPCFPFERWTPESIPEGHAYPRLCDGFDRTFTLSFDDPSDPEVGPPGIELVRAITPFGGPLRFDADITDVANGLPGVHELHVDIQTWGDGAGLVSGSEGEWIVSARIVLEPGTAPRSVLAVVPLVFENQTDAARAPLPFTVPEGTASSRIEYRTTGHGGASVPDDAACIGPAEEFCQRTHALSLDGALLGELSPWRTDCAALCTLTPYEGDFPNISQYCAENPTGLPASVRAPRANWCPGSVTPPIVFENPELAEPGEHELSIAVDTIAEGGQWTTSALYFAFE
jgi:hypothetical protein